MTWKSVGIVEGENATFVLQQKYIPPQNTRPNKTRTDSAAIEPDSEHRLVSVYDLIGEGDLSTGGTEKVNLDQNL